MTDIQIRAMTKEEVGDLVSRLKEHEFAYKITAAALSGSVEGRVAKACSAIYDVTIKELQSILARTGEK